MKRIEAIIRHFKFQDVKNVLTSIGIGGMTVTDVHGFGRERGQIGAYRGTEYEVDTVPNLMLVIYVSDALWKSAVEELIRAAYTGNPGDGKVVVTDVLELIRIRTGETGDDAV